MQPVKIQNRWDYRRRGFYTNPIVKFSKTRLNDKLTYQSYIDFEHVFYIR